MLVIFFTWATNKQTNPHNLDFIIISQIMVPTITVSNLVFDVSVLHLRHFWATEINYFTDNFFSFQKTKSSQMICLGRK